jgi:hypothetical protein
MREGVAGTVRLIASRSKLKTSESVTQGKKTRVGALVLSLKLPYACICKFKISLELLV